MKLLTIVRLIKTHMLTIDSVSKSMVIWLDQNKWLLSFSANLLKIFHFFCNIYDVQ